jgi:polar amino acid transport system substrate-binding protein
MKRGRTRPRRIIGALVLALLLTTAAVSGCTAAAGQTGASQTQSLYTIVKSRGVLRVGVRPDDPPHSYLNSQGHLVGFDVDIATAIAKDWGVKLQLVTVNELTRISYLQNGRIDLAVTSISKTVSRAKEVDFSETYFFSDQTILVRKGAYPHLIDLLGKTIAADRGSNAGDSWLAWLAAHGHAGDGHIEYFASKQASLEAVKTGAVAGYAEDYELLASFAHNDPSVTVIKDAGGIAPKLDGAAMHKNDSLLVLMVNLALQHIASSGEYNVIYNRWFGPNSAAPVPLMGHIEVWPNG